MFKNYQSRPITRRAHQITKDDNVRKVLNVESTYVMGLGAGTTTFKAHERVREGDYVIHNTDDDIYHCAKDVFEERNIID